MRIQRYIAVAVLLLVCASRTVLGQDAGTVGLTTGAPSGIGLQWHLNKAIAVRPEFSFSTSSTKTSGANVTNEGDGWSAGTNVSVLFYLRTDDKLRTYFSPRVSWSHLNTTSRLAGPIINPLTGVSTSESKTTGKAIGAAGSFGAQYSLGTRFLVFGELGLSYAHTTTTSNLVGTKQTANAWGTRTAVGIVFYP